MQFVLPGKEQRSEAISPLDNLPARIRPLFDQSGFVPLSAPKPGEWLAVHHEPGQTSAAFLRSRPNYPNDARRTIYLQPLEQFSSDGPSVQRLKEFTEAFFSLPVKVLQVFDTGRARITTRINPETNKPQMLTGDVLNLLKQRLPKDAYCLLGITLCDLYPDPAWNFVFGQATLSERVGVYSFARYDPHFWGEESPDREKLILRRSCRVLAHETGHMFGIEHCIYFHCVMNGSNSLPEDDAGPLHLCPVDLRKLYESIRFDLIARYAHLRDFCREVGFGDEARWIEEQLARVPSHT